MIPHGWDQKELGRLVFFKSGGTPSKAVRDYWDGDIPWISAKDMKSFRLDTSEDRITTLGAKNGTSVVPKDTLLILVRGMTLRKDVPVCITSRSMAFNQDVKALIPKNLDPTYLGYFLASRKSQLLSLVNEAGHGTGRLQTDFLEVFPILIPPALEQLRIAEVIEKWDRGIDLTERLIAAQEERFSWLNQSLIGDRCHNWEHFRADRIFKSISDKAHNGEVLLSVTQDRGVIPRSMLEGRVMSPESGTDSYKLIQVGDFAISLRSFQGGIEYSRYRGLISPAYTVLRPKVELHDDFFRHFFKSHVFIRKYLNVAVIGIRDGKQISVPDFMTVKIPMPPLSEQKVIARALDTAQKELDLFRSELDALREQKKGLMQQLLTGKKRVNIPVALATAEGQQ